ncbi:MAG: AhpC/TSA family protein [Chitinophagaceae bacterium]|nr:MAG: AhpC/TSA family protein [Chitinophagaceae bacterium]
MIIRLLAVLLLSTPVLAQDRLKPFQLTVVVRDLPDSAKVSKMYLTYPQQGKLVKDSAKVVNGRCRFSGMLAEPVEADLSAVASIQGTKLAEQYTYLVYMIFIEPGRQKVIAKKQLHSSAFTAKGSTVNRDYLSMYKERAKYEAQYQYLYSQILDARRAGDRQEEFRLQRIGDSITAIAWERIYAGFLVRHPDSPASLFAWERYERRSSDPAKTDSLFRLLSPEVRALARGKKIEAKLEEGRSTGIGKTAPGFSQADTLGQQVQLASFRGNYVLLDFWASWCVPCRLENPTLVAEHAKYRDLNFKIVSISLDRAADREEWVRAIRKDGLSWTHLSDLLYWKNAVARLYGIEAIPQNLLIDPQGIIVAKNLRGAALENKLKEVFAPKKAF